MAYCCVKNHALECDGCEDCFPEEIEEDESLSYEDQKKEEEALLND